MYAVRLGSYSMAATLAGIPSRRRLKSTLRYRRLAPPPRWRDVLRPLALRPPDFLSPSTSVRSGSVFVISAKSGYETKRRPGDVGLGLRMGIGLRLLEAVEALEDRDGLTRRHLDDRLLPRPCAARGLAAALGLGLHRHRADLDDVDVEERLDGLADLRLVGVRVDPERVLVGRREHVGLLAHDRADDHLAGVHQALASSAVVVFSPLARAVSSSRAVGLTSTLAAPTRSATPTLVVGITARTSARLRKLSAARSSASPRTMTREPLAPQSATSLAAALVETSSNALGSKTAIEPRSAWIDSALRNAARRSLRLTLKV